MTSISSTVATMHSEGLFGGDPHRRCQLVVIEGVDVGRAAGLEAGEVVVGSDPACNLVLGDERVSRRHLTVTTVGDGFRVQDLGSRNGTLYAGSVIREATVGVGATLKVGHTFLRIQPQPKPVEVAPSQLRRFGDLVAESLTMREVFAVLELAAQSTITVLLEGETGTGKELAARAIHEASDRRSGPFVAVDCGALPEGLLESELFGHVRGAFTGAASDRKGAFSRANGGSIFLDEIDSVPLPVQARLLRVIEERKVRAVGADVERDVDIRILVASRANLSTLTTEGKFRPDLYYRISVLRIDLPPLRTRREDIAPIVRHMLRLNGIDTVTVDGANLDRLIAYDWPGNVRELRNVIDRAVMMSPGAIGFADLRLDITASHAQAAGPLSVRTDLPFADAKQLLIEAFERRYLRDLLNRCEGNISATAREAGVDRKHLRGLLRRHGLL